MTKQLQIDNLGFMVSRLGVRSGEQDIQLFLVVNGKSSVYHLDGPVCFKFDLSTLFLPIKQI